MESDFVILKYIKNNYKNNVSKISFTGMLIKSNTLYYHHFYKRKYYKNNELLLLNI